MTDVSRDDFTLIASIDDVLPLYRGNGLSAGEQRIGFETEIYLYKKDAQGNPVAASSAECAALIDALKAAGENPQLEMASAVEYASDAYRVTEVEKLSTEIEKKFHVYQKVINNQGLVAHDGAILPFTTLDSARENIVDRDRARGLVTGMTLFRDPAFLKVTLLCTSTQVSLSYRDPQDLYETLATGYALSAAIFGIFANHPPFIEGSGTPLQTQPRAAFYENFGSYGGIPDSFLHARDGDDFIRRHAAQVFDTEMLFYYDAAQNLVWPEKPVKFSDLAALSLNTRSNYDLAESFIYHDLKVCNIRDASGAPTGKRVEVRGIDAGTTGIHGAVPFIHSLLRDPWGKLAVEGLLLDYGVHVSQDGWQERITAGRHNAAHHGGKFLDVPFGQRPDGSTGSLRDFCQDIGLILQQYAARNPALAKHLAPVISICRTGKSDAARRADAAPTYQQAIGQLFAGAGENRTWQPPTRFTA